jgi:LysM repeat protein
MTEKDKPERNSEIEDQLSRLYRSASPSPAFSRRLENQIQQRARQMADSPAPAPPRSWGEALRGAMGWVWALAGFALLAVVIVFAVSLLPQRPTALPLVISTQETAQATAPAFLVTSTEAAAETPVPVQATPAQVSLMAPGVITYTVQEGDTLLAIAEKYGVSVASLFELNQLTTGDVLTPGKVLLIAELYRVVPGDTCASIASKFGITVETLMQTNNLSPTCDSLRSNQELIIPVNRELPTPIPQAYVLPKLDVVNLRIGPGTTYDVVGTLSPGEKLLKNGDVNPEGWAPVEYPAGSGQTAWVWVELVTVIDPADARNLPPAPTDWVRLSNPRRDGDKLLVDTCFNLIDDGDWMIRDATLRYEQDGEQIEISYDAGILISLRPFTTDSEGANPGERCDVLEFPVGQDVPLENASFSVRSLQAYPREGQDCDLYMTRVQPLLTARDTGILISCESQPHTGGVVSVIAKPDGMSQEQAQAVVYQAFEDATSLRGPWEFKLDDLLPEGSNLPDLETQQPLLKELRELNRLRAQNYFQAPGWVHMHSREMMEESMGTLPDGTALPKEYQLDDWYELDANGLVVRAVSRQMDLSGNLLQMSLLKDGRWTDLNTSESWEQPPYELSPLDYAFTDLATSAAKTGKSLTRQSLSADGKYGGERYVIMDDEIRRESVYDPATGRLISFSTWQVMPEGLQFVSSVVIETLENLPAAPPEVLAYFNQ